MFQLGFENQREVVRFTEEFRTLRVTFRWKTKGITANRANSTESKLNIPEASARSDVDDYYTATDDDHYSVSRPCKKNQISYRFLSDLIHESTKEPSSSKPSSSGKFESSLLFGFDKNYVPMNDTIDEIDEAFKRSLTIVLHGDSGTGKSSLARYYVLRFEESRRKMDPGQSCSSPIACFLHCGQQANVLEILRQQVQAFKLKPDFEPSGVEEIHKLQSTLVRGLRPLDALTILDDVWERNLLDEVLVQGNSLKYLITTRKENLWPDPNAERIKIQPLSKNDAPQILANYAKFEDGRIPEQFKVQADELINTVQFHPLAVATLGTVLQSGDKSRADKFRADKWKSLKQNLLKYLKNDDYRSLNCGASYPRSVSAALMLMVDSTVLGDALNLLYVINLFQGPLISESMVRFFIKYWQPTALEDFDCNIDKLECLSLVERVYSPDLSEILVLSISASFEGSPFDKTMLKGDTSQLQIHDLRQRFILEEKKDDMDALKGFLSDNKESCSLGQRSNEDFSVNSPGFRPKEKEKRSNEDWATALCAVFGEASVRNKARRKMGQFYLGSSDPDAASKNNAWVSDYMANILDYLPDVCFEEDKFNDGTSDDLAIKCTEVLWNLFITCRVDGHTISALLKEKNFMDWACRVLFNCLHCDLITARELADTNMDIRRCTDSLIALLSKNSTTEKVLLILDMMTKYIYDARIGSNDPLDCVLDTGKLVSTLVTKDFFAKDQRNCTISLRLITKLAFGAPYQASMFVQIPSYLEHLVGLLAEDVDVRVQQAALLALWQTVDHDADHNHMILDAFENVSMHLLQRLVPLLSKNLGRRCELSISLLRVLAESRKWSVMIVNSSCLQKVIKLLDEDVAADVQIIALQALKCIVPKSIDRGPFKMLPDEEAVIFDVLATITSDLLQRIVPFLSKDQGAKCSSSALLVQQLCSGPSCALIIINCHSCLPKLIQLLAEDVDAELRRSAHSTLLYISRQIRLNPDLLSFDLLAGVASDLVLGIVPLCFWWERDLDWYALLWSHSLDVLLCLGTTPSCAVMIANSPSCQDKLHKLLAKGEAAHIPENILQAIRNMLVHQDTVVV